MLSIALLAAPIYHERVSPETRTEGETNKVGQPDSAANLYKAHLEVRANSQSPGLRSDQGGRIRTMAMRIGISLPARDPCDSARIRLCER